MKLRDASRIGIGTGEKGRLRIQTLLLRMNDSDPPAAWDAALELAHIRSRTATRPLLALARSHPHKENRRAAIYVLGLLADRRSVDCLIHILNNRDAPPHIRSEAAEALTFARDRKRAVVAVLNNLLDPEPEVRLFTANCVGLWREQRAESLLRQLLGDTRAAGVFGTVAEEAARGLAALQDARAAP